MKLGRLFYLSTALVLAACSRNSEAPPEAKASTPTTATLTSAGTGTTPAAPALAAASTEAVLPKLGKLDAVDYEGLKKTLTDAGWKVSGSATKSAMYSIIATLTKGEHEIKLSYLRDGGPSWKKRLEKDGAAIHEEGDVLVGIVVVKGGADAKKVLASMI